MSGFGSRTSGFFGGASGGGGGGGLTSVATDGVTILGDGTVGSPIYATGSVYTDANLDLGTGDVTLPKAGVYRVISFGNTLYFPLSNLDGQRITIINSQAYATGNVLVNGNGNTIIYQGTNIPITSIPSGTTYEFVYSNDATEWYCYNPQNPYTSPRINLDLFGSNYYISSAGTYTFASNSTGYSIGLPDATYYNGLQITIVNIYTSALGISTTFAPYPKNPNGTNITTIGAGTSRTFCAIDYNGSYYWIAI